MNSLLSAMLWIFGILTSKTIRLMDIFERNYKAVVNRGLITPKTKDIDFYYKLLEEVQEVMTALFI